MPAFGIFEKAGRYNGRAGLCRALRTARASTPIIAKTDTASNDRGALFRVGPKLSRPALPHPLAVLLLMRHQLVLALELCAANMGFQHMPARSVAQQTLLNLNIMATMHASALHTMSGCDWLAP